MLEFQEGFFDQEVRDGFYLDTTMKTLWAAELEVLQKVAEVCDRHGLKWYAAYGTLLGAIRHEGFVPWDDDMDIWVKRPDYNILMQVLPNELPEGYLVRGPLTDEGYDQFHTCINSGNGISITKEWLEQYHGCPFTVGLDIFPLDYLPRNEKDRALQVNLLTMTGRIAQLAKMLGRGDFDPKDSGSETGGLELSNLDVSGLETDNLDARDLGTGILSVRNLEASKLEDGVDGQGKVQTLKESVIEEIKLGMEYIEENCKLQIEHQLLEDEKWDKVSSELWKWANYLAMMYSEEESDYLVEFFDYIQCPHKKYPKEWFADGYSATFENFMIPIPAGYDQILRYIYGLRGNYFVRHRKSGTHEYPYYARQLRQLREYVRDIQQRAQDVGMVSIDDIEVKEDTRELLPEWIPLALKADGSRKKVVLSANDPAVYVMYGNRALDKLEEILYSFEQVKDSVLLWWRPQPVMKKILDQVSPELSERYQGILNRYKEAGWGVCDETDNTDRAVEACDIYYGDMNAVIQPFQNAGKPVMLSVIEDGEEWKINAERINECRLFMSMPDFVEDEQHFYFVNSNYNALVVANKETGKIVKSVSLAGYQADIKNMHLRYVQQQNQIYFLPAGAPCIHIYNMENGEQKICDFLKQEKGKAIFRNSWDYFLRDDQIYLLPCRARLGLWSLTVQEDSPVSEDWWKSSTEGLYTIYLLRHGVIDRDRFYTFEVSSDKLCITNVSEQTVECVIMPEKKVQHIAYDGQNFWYTLIGASDIVCWNQQQGVVDRYLVPYDDYYIIGSSYGMETYRDICFASGHLFLLSGDGRVLYVLNQETRELQTLHVVECARGAFSSVEMTPSFKHIGNSLICMLQNAGEMLIIDLETLNVRQVREIFNADSPVKEALYEQSYKLLLDRKALLFEEKGRADLAMLIQYCMGD